MQTTTPESVGLSAERLSRIDPIMEKYISDNELAGMITLIARQGQVAHLKTYGMRHKEADQPMTLDTIFRIYSMTKPVASVALMMLYEQGLFHLDDPASKFIPDFKRLKVCDGPAYTGLKLSEPDCEMTIRHLLTHTAGLSYGWFDDTPVDALYRELQPMDRQTSLEEMVKQLAEIPLAFHPGSAWRYSVATDVVGYLVQAISGLPLETYLGEKIFQPLGMAETGFHVPADKVDRFAAVYGPCETNDLKVDDDPTTSQFLTPPNLPSGGGGLVSTIADYLQFAQMLRNQGELAGTRLLSRKSIELMTLNHLPAALLPIEIGGNLIAGYGFGLGFRVMVDVAASQALGSVGEYGWSGAANTYFWIDPAEDMIGILMTQFMPSGTYPISRDFRVLAYQSIMD